MSARTCGICGTVGGPNHHVDRRGVDVCGPCWVERERVAHLGTKLREIVTVGRILNVPHDELLRRVVRAVREHVAGANRLRERERHCEPGDALKREP